MDDSQKFLLKVGGGIFALLIAGSWLWVWIFPENPNRYNVPTPAPTQTIAPNTGQGTTSYYIDPCEDEPTVEDYKFCLEQQAIEDLMDERRNEAGLP
jgi:hypothetical protein